MRLLIREVSKYCRLVSYVTADRNLSINHLSDNSRWLRVVDSFQILLHSRIVVAFAVQEISILAVDLVHGIDTNMHPLRQANREDVHVSFV